MKGEFVKFVKVLGWTIELRARERIRLATAGFQWWLDANAWELRIEAGCNTRCYCPAGITAELHTPITLLFLSADRVKRPCACDHATASCDGCGESAIFGAVLRFDQQEGLWWCSSCEPDPKPAIEPATA